MSVVDSDTAWRQHLRDQCNNDEKWRSENPDLLPSSSKMQKRSEPTQLQRRLFTTAAAVRATLSSTKASSSSITIPFSIDELSFDSAFEQRGDQPEQQGARGFSNWLIPGRIMIGQYPGQNPLPFGPSEEEVAEHLRRVATPSSSSSKSKQLGKATAGVSVFCSLQRETPAQDDPSAWDFSSRSSTPNTRKEEQEQCGQCFLQPEAVRKQLPLPFVQYAPLVLQNSSESSTPIFLHAPIEDLSVPECQDPLQRLLLQLLEQMLPETNNEKNTKAIYIHCWGGRGRAGLVGACLLTLLYPSLSATTILQWVQQAYATRAGHDILEPEFAQSPQTSAQRCYAECFVHEYHDLMSRADTISSSQIRVFG